MKTHLLLPALLLMAFAATAAAIEPDNGFTVHEWGTFTSVQGADGVQMAWNPQIVSELPKFVYKSEAGGKIFSVGRQRLETPVIYFYSDRPRTVDVAVRFPGGWVTEWYPSKPAAVAPAGLPAGPRQPVLFWNKVEILGPTTKTPPLPSDQSGSHYYAARETDASLIRTTTIPKPVVPVRLDRVSLHEPPIPAKSEVEKFLFYRGVGNFQAPLTVKLGSNDAARVSLTNAGQEELRSLFLYEVRADGHISWMPIEKLPGGATRDVTLDPAAGTNPEALAAALRAALVAEGLYEKEAAAMVKTWQDSWFAERGLRVLYTLPRPWTDRALPLAVSPTPRSVQRVMVGRAEIITPAMESALLKEVERYIAAKEEDRPKIVAETAALGMGRFAEVARNRLVAGTARDPVFRDRSWELVRAANPIPVAIPPAN